MESGEEKKEGKKKKKKKVSRQHCECLFVFTQILDEEKTPQSVECWHKSSFPSDIKHTVHKDP